MAQANSLEESNLIFSVDYGEPEDMGPSPLHPHADPLQDHGHPQLFLRQPDPINNKCLQTAIQCSL